jgi:hypothetical protein
VYIYGAMKRPPAPGPSPEPIGPPHFQQAAANGGIAAGAAVGVALLAFICVSRYFRDSKPPYYTRKLIAVVSASPLQFLLQLGCGIFAIWNVVVASKWTAFPGMLICVAAALYVIIWTAALTVLVRSQHACKSCHHPHHETRLVGCADTSVRLGNIQPKASCAHCGHDYSKHEFNSCGANVFESYLETHVVPKEVRKQVGTQDVTCQEEEIIGYRDEHYQEQDIVGTETQTVMEDEGFSYAVMETVSENVPTTVTETYTDYEMRVNHTMEHFTVMVSQASYSGGRITVPEPRSRPVTTTTRVPVTKTRTKSVMEWKTVTKPVVKFGTRKVQKVKETPVYGMVDKVRKVPITMKVQRIRQEPVFTTHTTTEEKLVSSLREVACKCECYGNKPCSCNECDCFTCVTLKNPGCKPFPFTLVGLALVIVPIVLFP